MDEIKVSLVEYFDEHWYHILRKKESVDSWICSVTTKMGIEEKPFLVRWYGDLGWREARRRLTEAGERGKRIHYAWYIYLMGGVVVYNPYRNPIFTQAQLDEMGNKASGLLFILDNQDEMVQLWKLQRFFEIVNPEIVESEKTVFSIQDDIAGTLDNAFLIKAGTYDVNGAEKLVIPETGVYIADLKTGNVEPENVWEQLAAYERAYISMGYEKPKGALCIHTSSKTKKGIPGLSVSLRTSNELKRNLDIYLKIADIWRHRNPKAHPLVFQFPNVIKRNKEN